VVLVLRHSVRMCDCACGASSPEISLPSVPRHQVRDMHAGTVWVYRVAQHNQIASGLPQHILALQGCSGPPAKALALDVVKPHSHTNAIHRPVW
jgi:hypothetical protein